MTREQVYKIIYKQEIERTLSMLNIPYDRASRMANLMAVKLTNRFFNNPRQFRIYRREH